MLLRHVSAQIEMPIPILDLGEQYAAIREEIHEALNRVLASQHFILGAEVEALEDEVAHFCTRRFGVGVASGTDALILALRAAGISKGDEVIVPSFTFIATADAVSLLGGVPVFVDILADTFCMDPCKIAEKITPRTKALIPVHLYGQAADMDPILEIARQHGLKVIEDNAQAIGATYKGRKTASIGDIGCLSFYPSKNLGAYGDAGMVVTDCEQTALKLRVLRSHGGLQKYVSEEQGWNSRLDEMQAAILRVKLRHLDRWNEARRSRAALYDSLLSQYPSITRPKVAEYGEHVFHQYTIRTPHRERIKDALANSGTGCSVYYPVPIHLQGIYKHLGYKAGDLPVTEQAASEVLSLPIYPELRDEQVEMVVEVIGKSL
jgi:dTDP-4-amino-4,6-dideoxygalactose transaminase